MWVDSWNLHHHHHHYHDHHHIIATFIIINNTTTTVIATTNISTTTTASILIIVSAHVCVELDEVGVGWGGWRATSGVDAYGTNVGLDDLISSPPSSTLSLSYALGV